ncbi:MAG TPA: glycoside hydrolase family 31 protein [Verrucomicrobiae bacterium]|jgi:alpha-glucosidase|nr:glycoside hydrolase family 31 protein [Verrucomicrobiae bacterium]
MNKWLFFCLALFVLPHGLRGGSIPVGDPTRIVVPVAGNACWWAGIIDQGFQMPLANGYAADLCDNTYGNQAQPLLLSSRGDIIWSDDDFTIQLSQSGLIVDARSGRVHQARSGDSLRDAFLYASRTHFPPTGKMPDAVMFEAPQYNTWIELMYDQSQAGILNYAKGIKENGFPPGVLMIDDNWQQNYGQWDFKRDKFPDAKAMITRLHQQGFKIMVWICPFVNTNSDPFLELAERQLLLKDASGAPALVEWWNGRSALLDLTNPQAIGWLRAQLDRLHSDYQVDGFKFDGGDSSFYKGVVASQSVSPNTQCELYGRIGLQYPLNEYRAMWKMGGQPLVERLRDKAHSWDDLRKLVPNMLLEGLMGYPFCCPDMIGGGEYKSFQAGAKIDQELVVRSAQCHALMPMMQFSVAPWRVLDSAHLDAVRKAIRIRQAHSGYILSVARQSASTGEPIVRSMEYAFPHQGYERVNDQFLLGEQILVAPVLEQGATNREVVLPVGAWKGFDGKQYAGSRKIIVPVADDDLCYFERVAGRGE